MTVAPIVRLLRPYQYTKNLLVFAAPGAAGTLTDPAAFGRTSAAFVLFCAVSSFGYIVNDLADIDADQAHPRKRNRPLASGAVQPRAARAALIALGLGAVIGASFLGWSFAATLAAYAAVTLSYTGYLKRVPWVEMTWVSLGFVLRSIAGGRATDVGISAWFVIVVSAGALLLIAGKRIGERAAMRDTSLTRKVLASYPPRSLELLAVTAGAIAVLGYAGWAVAEAPGQATSATGETLLRLTTVAFVVAIGRFVSLSLRGRGEQPELLVLRDPVVVAAGLCWVGLFAAGVYT